MTKDNKKKEELDIFLPEEIRPTYHSKDETNSTPDDRTYIISIPNINGSAVEYDEVEIKGNRKKGTK